MKTVHPLFPPLVLGVGLFVGLGFASGCGNYSNTDLDFQLALPEKGDLSAKLPQALVDANTPEYYLATREVVLVFNTIINNVTDIVDRVRAFAPTERRDGIRIWGPFPDREKPGWNVRMRMERQADPASALGFRLTYDIEFQAAGAATEAWSPLVAGFFSPASGGPRQGVGQIRIELGPARAQGYPIREFGELARLTIDYQRATFPHDVVMVLENVPESPNPGSTTTYRENADGSGALSFVWRKRNDIWVQAAEMLSRWMATGAGRADARITEGLAAMGNPLGVDCWGPSAQATYVLREFGNRREEGSAQSCVFGPAP